MTSQLRNFLLLALLIVVLTTMTSSVQSRRSWKRRNSVVRRKLIRTCSASCIRSTSTFSYVKSCKQLYKPAACIYCRFVLKCKYGSNFI